MSLSAKVFYSFQNIVLDYTSVPDYTFKASRVCGLSSSSSLINCPCAWYFRKMMSISAHSYIYIYIWFVHLCWSGILLLQMEGSYKTISESTNLKLQTKVVGKTQVFSLFVSEWKQLFSFFRIHISEFADFIWENIVLINWSCHVLWMKNWNPRRIVSTHNIWNPI